MKKYVEDRKSAGISVLKSPLIAMLKCPFCKAVRVDRDSVSTYGESKKNSMERVALRYQYESAVCRDCKHVSTAPNLMSDVRSALGA